MLPLYRPPRLSLFVPNTTLLRPLPYFDWKSLTSICCDSFAEMWYTTEPALVMTSTLPDAIWPSEP